MQPLLETRLPLVSVVVPMFNAEKTVEETLRSALAQDYPRFEIIVIDDGCQDSSAVKVEAMLAAYPYLRLIRQANQGVAAARNLGVAKAKGDLIAFLDADDLWLSDKLTAQVEAMLAAGPSAGLCYTWSIEIDEQGREGKRSCRSVTGDALAAMCRSNPIGSGSAPMLRKAVILEVGGFDSGLRDVNAQGCDDWKLFALVASRYDIVTVERILTRYRVHRNSISSDFSQMLRSNLLVASQLSELFPQHADALKRQHLNLMMALLLRALVIGDLPHVAKLAVLMLAYQPARAMMLFLIYPAKPLRGLLRRLRSMGLRGGSGTHRGPQSLRWDL